MVEPGLAINSAIAAEEADKVEMAPSESAFDLESAVHDHARFLFGVAYSVLRNVAEAEDVVQETFLRAHRSRTSSEVCDTKAWLARIAWRLAVGRSKRTQETPLDDLETTRFELPATGPALDDAVAREQTVDLLHRLISNLPEELRQPLVLSTVQEMNSSEIGAVLGIPESSVRTRLFRARKILKEKMQSLMERSHGA